MRHLPRELRDAVIRNNTLTGNDMKIAGISLFYGADIFLNDSKNTEIYGNTINAGVHGIGLHDIDRGSGPYGLYEIRNDYVHDNTVTLPSGGQTASSAPDPPHTHRPRRTASHNSYLVLNTTAASWLWNSGRLVAMAQRRERHDGHPRRRLVTD